MAQGGSEKPTNPQRSGGPVPARTWPLLPLPPAIVVLAGLAMAIALVVSGMGELRRASDGEALERAETLGQVLAARLRRVAVEDRAPLLARAAEAASVELLLASQDGRISVGPATGAPRQVDVVAMLVQGQGITRGALGRSVFSAQTLAPPLEHLSVVVLVRAPDVPPGAVGLAETVAALTVVLLALAAIVSLAFVRAARDDVAYVGTRVLAMARPDEDLPAGEPVPIRTLDQVGALTASFNLLVTRFAEAERGYRADLTQAAAIDAELSEFLAGLSHELRTPLNAILGFSHLLESEVDGPMPVEALEYLAIVRTSGEHLRQLVDDVLDLSALEGGQLVLALRDADLRPIIDEVVAEARPAAAAKGLEVVGGGDPVVLAHVDKRRVRQIVTNLVQNAIKFTTKGTVRVQVRRLEDGVELRVVDTGLGIAESERSTIFEEYRQVGPERQRRAGVGLGLAIVRRLVTLHRGRIYLGSEIGRGSTFVIRLPGPTALAPSREGENA